MGNALVRGHMISTAAEFVCQTATVRGLPDPSERFSAPLRAALGGMSPVGWYPVDQIAELNRLIASSLANNDEARARADLEKCGRFMAVEATNAFMRRLMRVLTPTLFAKQLPDLWRRNCAYGHLELEVDDRTMTMRLDGMDGHDHVAAVMPGYVGVALEKMGKVIECVTLRGWSLTKPNANGAEIQFAWKTTPYA